MRFAVTLVYALLWILPALLGGWVMGAFLPLPPAYSWWFMAAVCLLIGLNAYISVNKDLFDRTKIFSMAAIALGTIPYVLLILSGRAVVMGWLLVSAATVAWFISIVIINRRM